MSHPQAQYIPKRIVLPKFVIGIDPDLHKSGVAIWNTEDKSWRMYKAIPNGALLDTLAPYYIEQSIVYLEAGWLNQKANFRGGNYGTAQSKARDAGMNMGAGQVLVQILEHAGYKVELVKPLDKGLFKDTQKGRWTKAGQDHITQRMGFKAVMNDDVRDAVFIVLHFI